MHLPEQSGAVTGVAFCRQFTSKPLGLSQTAALKGLELAAAKDDPNARLDLGKLQRFLPPVNFDWVRRTRERVNRGGQYPSEQDVKFAFEIYCKTLREKVEYTYNSAVAVSPFNPNFAKYSDCLGRAIGFLQLLAALGVPLGWLHIVTVGREDDENKILRLQDNKIVSENVYRVPSETEEEKAPNALMAELKTVAGKEVVDFRRTVREPFANHNVAKVVGPLTFRCWDPLLERAYRNSVSDFFESYERKVERQVNVVYYQSPAEPRRRLYYLPSTLGSKMNCGAAFAAVSAEMGKMSAAAPSVCLIVDEEDWGKTQPPKHPPVVEHIFNALS